MGCSDLENNPIQKLMTEILQLLQANKSHEITARVTMNLINQVRRLTKRCKDLETKMATIQDQIMLVMSHLDLNSSDDASTK